MKISYLSEYLIAGVLALSPMKNSASEIKLEDDLENKTSSYNCYIKKDTINTNTKWPNVYDYAAHKFVTKKGGLSEEFLNKISDDFAVSEDCDLCFDFFSYVDTTETFYKWSKLDGDELSNSISEVYLTIASNFDKIFLADISEKKDLPSKYHSLKDLLLSLDSIAINYYDNEPKKLIRTYELLQRSIALDREDTYASVSIDRLLNGKNGNCDDIAPMFYSILRYYGFDACMRFGQFSDINGNIGYHAWVGLRLNDIYIDLDPTWYVNFAPLENRSNSIPTNFLEKRCTIKLPK
ncbi:MAG: transglutaminase domain-containing protein [Candidatus Woesearchaeota archaeon]